MSDNAIELEIASPPKNSGLKHGGALKKKKIRLKKTGRKKLFDKGKIYRLSRKLHIYLSAMAFILLLFFSLSGLMLNHPEWLQGERVKEKIFLTLTADEISKVKEEKSPKVILTDLLKQKVDIPGEISGFEDLGDGYQLAFRGLAGTANIFVDYETGKVDIEVKHATLTDKFHVLHKGKNTGDLWSLALDFTAVMTLILSLFGFIILFTVKKRKALSFKMIGLSVLIIGAIISFAVV